MDNHNTKQDDILITLGEELEELCGKFNKAVRASHETNDLEERERLESIVSSILGRTDSICYSISAFKASTLRGAAMQVLAMFHLRDNKDFDKQMDALLLSILSVLELSGGFSCGPLAKDVLFPGCDPFAEA